MINNKMNMLQHFLDDFLQLVPLQLPKLLDANAMEEPQFFNDYVLLHFPLNEAYDLEEIMDMFEDDMELMSGDLLRRMQPAFQASFGRWLTPWIGARLGYQGYQFRDCLLSNREWRYLFVIL